MRKIISIIGILISLILMALPYGVSMTFADGPGNYLTYHFSYFSSMPIGYGNWLPIITAVLSIAIFILILLDNKIKTEKPVKICLAICLLASFLSWIIFNAISVLGIIITLVHVTLLIFQFIPRKRLKFFQR